MVTKTRKESANKKKKIKVLNLKKETVKNLSDDEAKGVKGGTTQCLAGRLDSILSGVKIDPYSTGRQTAGGFSAL